MTQRVLTTIDTGVAHVRLNRPDKRNSLDAAMFEGIIDAGKALSVDTSVRAIILSGEGAGFCAGLDFMAFMGGGMDAMAMLGDRHDGSPANVAQRVAWIWQEVPVPVIAAIHGFAYGGGLQIALGCDMRYATPDAKFSVMEGKWGLIPDMGISKTLPSLVPLDVAKELTFTGRIVDAEEALRRGLITRLCQDPVTDALETARLIAAKNPHAIRAGKRLFNEAPSLPVADAFVLETELQIPLLGSRNQMEAVQANFAKRAPLFEDPKE